MTPTKQTKPRSRALIRAEALKSARRGLALHFRVADDLKRQGSETPGAIGINTFYTTQRLVDEYGPGRIVGEARKGNKDAMIVVADFLVATMKSGARMPAHLTEYASDLLTGRLDPPLKSGTSAAVNDIRNHGIALGVHCVIAIHGLSATAASEIVSEALMLDWDGDLTPNSVWKIWKQRRAQFRHHGG